MRTWLKIVISALAIIGLAPGVYLATLTFIVAKDGGAGLFLVGCFLGFRA